MKFHIEYMWQKQIALPNWYSQASRGRLLDENNIMYCEFFAEYFTGDSSAPTWHVFCLFSDPEMLRKWIIKITNYFEHEDPDHGDQCVVSVFPWVQLPGIGEVWPSKVRGASAQSTELPKY